MAASTPSTFVILADYRNRPVDDWQQYTLEGRQYLRLAAAAFQRQKKAFTAEILYNLVTMAIEKLVMGALMKIGRLPANHTMDDLVSALEQWLPETVDGLEQPIRHLDSYQDICDPYTCTVTAPTAAEIETMIQLARQLEQRLDTASAECRH